MRLLQDVLLPGAWLFLQVFATPTDSIGQVEAAASGITTTVSLCHDDLVLPSDVQDCVDMYAAFGEDTVKVPGGEPIELCKIGSVIVTATISHGGEEVVKSSEVTNGIDSILKGCPSHGGSISIGRHGDVLILVRRNGAVTDISRAAGKVCGTRCNGHKGLKVETMKKCMKEAADKGKKDFDFVWFEADPPQGAVCWYWTWMPNGVCLSVLARNAPGPKLPKATGSEVAAGIQDIIKLCGGRGGSAQAGDNDSIIIHINDKYLLNGGAFP